MRFELNGTRQILICADDFNFLSKNLYSIEKAEALLATRKEVGLVVYAAKIKRVFTSHQQNTRQNQNI